MGLILDFKLTFEDVLNNVLAKLNKTVGGLLCNLLSRITLIIICKTVIRQHLDYVDVLCNQDFNNSFKEKMGSTQDNACLALTGAIKGTSKEEIYQEFILESFRDGR